MNEILRVAHETDLIRPVPLEEDLPDQLQDKHRGFLHEEIEARERIIAGLELEIQELEEILEER